MKGRSLRVPLVFVVVVVLACAPALAHAAFPGSNPNESVRINTPNDPDFDRCEPDDEEGPRPARNAFDQQYERFGFAPNGSQLTALYHNPLDPHVTAPRRAEHARRPQRARPGSRRVRRPGLEVLDRHGKRPGRDPRHRHPLEQRRAAEQGRRSTATSCRCRSSRTRAPAPRTTATATAPSTSTTTRTTRASRNAARQRRGRLDPRRQRPDRGLQQRQRRRLERLRRRHRRLGLLRRRQRPLRRLELLERQQPRHRPRRGGRRAGQRGLRRDRRLPALPGRADARLGHVRGRHATTSRMAALYAADNDIEVVEGAVGALFNSRFAREAFEYAYQQGVFFAIVSSDLNTADHNIPTLYDEAMQVQGTVADVARPRPEPAAGVHRLLQRPRRAARHQRPDRDLVPQLRHDPVRRPRAHRDAGRDRVGRDRPGIGRGGAGDLVRAPARRHARAERGQAADHDDGVRRHRARHRRASACPTRRWSAGTSTSATACPTSASRSSGSTRARSRRRR